MDRTLVNIASILVGGAGLFTVLTGFNVPQVYQSFFGTNPYLLKKGAIEGTVTWVFTAFALFGLLLQLGAEIWGGGLKDQAHDWLFYTVATVLMAVVVLALVMILDRLAKRIAKKTWLPEVVAAQSQLFGRSAAIVENDGWESEHARAAATQRGEDIDALRERNLSDANKNFAQIEELLEVSSSGDLRTRLARIRPFFVPQHHAAA